MIKLKTVLGRYHCQVVQAIILAVIFLKVYYIFHFTSYLFSVNFDMASYWHGAFERAWGDKFSFNQFGLCPAFPIYLFAYFLQLMNGLGILNDSLQLMIFLNVLLHGISSYIVYLIVYRLTVRKAIAFGALIVYLFSYTQLYMNALILPDNWGTPFLIIVIWIIGFCELNIFSIIGAGLLLGVAISAKPSFIILSTVFVWWVYSTNVKENKLLRAFLLSISILLVPVMTVLENYHISQGKVASLSATGGVNFFQGWAKVSNVSSESSGSGWLYSPGARDELYWKPFNTQEPWYNQGYFYKQGLEYIYQHPLVLLEKITWFKNLFFGFFAPTLSEQPEGYYQIMPVAQWILYIMFLSLWILCFLDFRWACDKTIYFLFSILGIFLLTIYLCGMPERRYLSYCEFLIVILFFVALDKIISLFKVYQKEIILYFCFVFSFFFLATLTYKKWIGLFG